MCKQVTLLFALIFVGFSNILLDGNPNGNKQLISFVNQSKTKLTITINDLLPFDLTPPLKQVRRKTTFSQLMSPFTTAITPTEKQFSNTNLLPLEEKIKGQFITSIVINGKKYASTSPLVIALNIQIEYKKSVIFNDALLAQNGIN